MLARWIGVRAGERTVVSFRPLALAGVLLMLSGGARGAPVDKPARFLLDLSSVCGKPIGIQVDSKKHLWQLPKSQVRKGFGLAWYWIDKATSNSSEARIYVEVEALGDRALLDAAGETAETVGATMEPFHTELVGDVLTGEREQFKFGRTVVLGYRLQYKIDITTAVPRSVTPATAIVFEHEGALVTVTVEDFNEKKSYVDPFLKSVEIVKLPLRAKPNRLKMVDATGHIYRYMTCEIPAGFTPEMESEYGVAASFALADPKGETFKSRITVRRIQPPRGRNMDFKSAVEWTRSNYADMYEDVSALEKSKLGRMPCYTLSYTDNEKPTRRVFSTFIGLHDQIWTWTFECASKDESEIKKAEAEFEKLLKSGNAWAIKPK